MATGSEGIVDRPDAQERLRSVRRVLWVILYLNLFVALAKAVVGLMGNSLSMVADAAHSTFDGGSNIVGLIAIGVAVRRPDEDHPYGHQRFEVVGAAIIGVFLATMAWHIVEGAVQRFGTPQAPEASVLQFATLGVTLAVNVVVAVYEARAGRRLGSRILVADAMHTKSDVFATLAVVGSLVAARMGYAAADPVIALVIAAYIAVVALRLILSSSQILADRSVLDASKVAEVVQSVEGVRDCHDVRTRGTEDAVFADLRIHVAAELPLKEAHKISHKVEKALRDAFPGIIDVVVHIEPGGIRHK